MDIRDITAALDRLYRDGQRVLADFAAAAERPGEANPEELLERLRDQMRGLFAAVERQLRDQAQPWIAMLRARAQLADGGSLAQLLMTPMAFWQPIDSGGAEQAADGEQRARVEAAAAELSQAAEAYVRQLHQAADDAVERFGTVLRTLDDGHHSLRRLYQYWLETAEAAYEEMLGSEAFAEAAGRLTNAWTGLLLLTQEDMAGLLQSLGVPSRRELSDTQAQLNELRRQQRTRERQLAAEIEALREAVQRLQSQLEAAAAPARERSDEA